MVQFQLKKTINLSLYSINIHTIIATLCSVQFLLFALGYSVVLLPFLTDQIIGASSDGLVLLYAGMFG